MRSWILDVESFQITYIGSDNRSSVQDLQGQIQSPVWETIDIDIGLDIGSCLGGQASQVQAFSRTELS